MLKFTCDNCGKIEPAVLVLVKETKDGKSEAYNTLPKNWLSNFDGQKIFDVCSYECAQAFDEKGKSDEPQA